MSLRAIPQDIILPYTPSPLRGEGLRVRVKSYVAISWFDKLIMSGH